MYKSDLVRNLEKAGFQVQLFDTFHHRINGEIDVWTNSRGRALSWHDRFTGDRGRVPENQVVFFVKRRLQRENTEQTKEEFMNRLMQIGWKYEEAEKSWNERNGNQ